MNIDGLRSPDRVVEHSEPAGSFALRARLHDVGMAWQSDASRSEVDMPHVDGLASPAPSRPAVGQNARTTIDLTAGQDDGVVRVRLAGDVDFYSAAELRKITEAIENFDDVREVRVNLESVAFLSVEGLGALTRLAADASALGIRIRAVAARGQPRKLIRQTGAHVLLGGEPHRATTPTTSRDG